MPEIIRIQSHNRELISRFLSIAGQALHHFRYFKQRPLSVLDNHLCTYVITQEEAVIGYGHLDQEDGIVWLGIAIADDYQGFGLGKLMMQALLSTAKMEEIPEICLAVDLDNEKALPLYYRFGFTDWKSTNKIAFLKWQL